MPKTPTRRWQGGYTDTIGEMICAEIMDGNSMRSICSSDDMPDRRTVLRWLTDEPDFAAKCAHARELQADKLFEDMQEVADTGNPDDVQRAKLRVSTMQWRASKLAPKKYGDKAELSVKGEMTYPDLSAWLTLRQS